MPSPACIQLLTKQFYVKVNILQYHLQVDSPGSCVLVLLMITVRLLCHRPWLSLAPRSPSAQMRSRRFCIICSSLQSSWTWRWTGPFFSGLQSTFLPASVTDWSDSDLQGKKRQTVRTKNWNKRKGDWKTTVVLAISIQSFSVTVCMKQLLVFCEMNHLRNSSSYSAVLEQYFPHWRDDLQVGLLSYGDNEVLKSV